MPNPAQRKIEAYVRMMTTCVHSRKLHLNKARCQRNTSQSFRWGYGFSNPHPCNFRACFQFRNCMIRQLDWRKTCCSLRQPNCGTPLKRNRLPRCSKLHPQLRVCCKSWKFLFQMNTSIPWGSLPHAHPLQSRRVRKGLVRFQLDTLAGHKQSHCRCTLTNIDLLGRRRLHCLQVRNRLETRIVPEIHSFQLCTRHLCCSFLQVRFVSCR